MSSSGLHGQKREYQTKEQKRLKHEAEKGKITEYNELDVLLLQYRNEQNYSHDALQQTAKMLNINPEYYTVWNYRREILCKIFETLDSEEIQGMLKQDISLVDSLLLRAPKSYWVWNHRRWVLDNMPVKQYDKELKIINYMLDLDSRNFHGWDYRRYVIGMNVSTPEKEFEYTNTKIKQNFSNYSAWHYRSKIMPLVFQGDALKKQIKEDIELVRDAVFTEPKDQSAWLYQRFLFGKKILNVRLNKAARKGNLLYLLFNQPVKMIKLANGAKIFNKTFICSELQILEYQELSDNIEFDAGTFVGSQLDLVSSKITIAKGEISQEYSNVPFDSKPLLEELPILKELLELEPDSKWVLLGILYIYTTLGIEKQESIKLLDHLQKIDKKRISYYKEKKSFLLLDLNDFQNDNVDYHRLGLSTLPKPHLFVFTSNLDLSNNDIHSLSFLKYLSLKELNLDDNRLSNLAGIQTQNQLAKLSVKNNKLLNSGIRDLLTLKLSSLNLEVGAGITGGAVVPTVGAVVGEPSAESPLAPGIFGIDDGSPAGIDAVLTHNPISSPWGNEQDNPLGQVWVDVQAWANTAESNVNRVISGVIKDSELALLLYQYTRRRERQDTMAEFF
ncbi:hypothetical protein HDV06_006692 [Boothiomyces sp. JEL0866]|nr:hypothetical protein HDV06_006692 [Boothiomyces sp. JEL0866]